MSEIQKGNQNAFYMAFRHVSFLHKSDIQLLPNDNYKYRSGVYYLERYINGNIFIIFYMQFELILPKPSEFVKFNVVNFGEYFFYVLIYHCIKSAFLWLQLKNVLFHFFSKLLRNSILFYPQYSFSKVNIFIA